MLRYAVRSLLARKARMTMSLAAIMLGVAFLAGVLTFNHGLRSTFDGIVRGSTPDAVVRLQGADAAMASQPSTARLTPTDVARLRALPEVSSADGVVGGYGVSLLDDHGKLVGGQGAPTIAFNHTGTRNLLGQPMMELSAGRWPSGPDDVVMDGRAAERAGYAVGDRVTLVTPTSDPLQRFRLAGIASFSRGGTAGAILLLFDTPTAQRLFLDGHDDYTQVDLTAAPGVGRQQLASAARSVAPPGFTAVTGDTVVAETQSQLDAFLGVISTFLTVFAAIAVLVCALMIINTFTIVVAQRSRELAVLRALGASRRQVTRAVLLEAALMALVATTIGIAVGWGLARLLAAAFRGLGLDIRSDALSLTTANAIACLAVGVLVTIAAAYLPARRAGRIDPVTAMRLDDTRAGASLRRRAILAMPLLAVASAALAVGLAGPLGHRSAWVGAGAAIWIVTMAALSGVVGRPVLRALRRLFARMFGATGALAGENALRDPRRTGATASALMIGIALVGTIGVLAASLNRSVDDLVDREFTADFVVEGAGYLAFPTAVGDRVGQVPGVEALARQQIVQAQLDGGDVTASANDRSFDRVYHLDMVAGRQAIGPGRAVVYDTMAAARHWVVGSTFVLHFAGGHALRLSVAGIARSTPVTAPISIAMSDLARMGIQRQDSALSILVTPGADRHTVHDRLDAAVADLPIVSVQDKDQFTAGIRDQVNQLVYLIDGLLALAIVIAIFGIINTLGLSIIERTRELGLLRAIGLSRVQLRWMVVLESVATALLGAVFGLVLGVVFGILLRQSLSNDITSLSVPASQLLAFLAGSAAVGVLAAAAPAVRASRLDVLQAIATE